MRSTYDIARTINGGRERGAILTDGRNYWRYSDRTDTDARRKVFGWQLRPDGSNGAYMELPRTGLCVHKP